MNKPSLIEKAMYGFFTYVPFSYRCFRILNDPTLIQWEQNEKKKR